jgi:hypothetical protein
VVLHRREALTEKPGFRKAFTGKQSVAARQGKGKKSQPASVVLDSGFNKLRLGPELDLQVAGERNLRRAGLFRPADQTPYLKVVYLSGHRGNPSNGVEAPPEQ